jgi:hypothetical protein
MPENQQNSEEETSRTSLNNNKSNEGLASPGGVIMLCLAVLFDAVGLIPIVGDISDVFAGIIIGGWMLVTGKKALKKFAVAFILEAIPIVSDIAPFVSLLSGGKLPASWIGCVYSTLKYG